MGFPVQQEEEDDSVTLHNIIMTPVSMLESDSGNIPLRSSMTLPGKSLRLYSYTYIYLIIQLHILYYVTGFEKTWLPHT